MATFFGEVLPVHSRAVDDEEEKDVPIDELYFHPALGKGLDCELFVCSVGPNSCTFTEVFLLRHDVELLTNLKIRHKQAVDDEKQMLGFNYRKVSKPSGSLFMDTRSSILYFTCDHVLIEQSALIASNLIDSIRSSKPTVLILTSCSVSEYKCEDIDNVTTPFLRCLTSSTYSTGTDNRKPPKKYPNDYLCCSFLEQPNAISGVAAAILTECEVKSIPSLLVVSYTDQSNIDSDCIKSFLQILSVAKLQATLKVNSNAEEELNVKLKLAAGNLKSLYT